MNGCCLYYNYKNDQQIMRSNFNSADIIMINVANFKLSSLPAQLFKNLVWDQSLKFVRPKLLLKEKWIYKGVQKIPKQPK